jgi:hypothetical protein
MTSRERMELGAVIVLATLITWFTRTAWVAQGCLGVVAVCAGVLAFTPRDPWEPMK